MRRTIAEGVKALREQKCTVHFRPEKHLTEEDQYCIVYEHSDILVENE